MTLQNISVSAEADEGIKAAISKLEKKRPDGVRMVEVNSANMIRAGASAVLALDPSVVGKMVALSPSKPVAKMGAVAHVAIRGPLAQRAISDMCGYVEGYDAVERKLMAALGDPEVFAVVLDIDSPGGDVAGCEQSIANMRKAVARSGKPVAVYVNEAAYSAAYWIAASLSTEGISMPPAGGVGSIGCIGGLVDETGALEQEGLKVTLIRYPAGKAESHSLQPIAELAEQRLSRRIEEVGERFIAAMAAARGIEADAVRGFNGDTFNGAAAKKAGLVDRIEDFESVVARAQTAGQKWRRATEQAMSDQNELETLRSFKSNALNIFGAKDESEFTGKATAAKAELDGAPERNAKAAANEQNLKVLQKQSDDRDAKIAIDAAQAANKVVLSNRAQVEAIYTDHGLKVLHVHLAALVPVAPSAAAAAVEPKPTNETPQQIAASTAGGPVNEGPKKFEAMAPMERHAYRHTQGDDAYAALKQDWIDRGKPAR